MRQTCIAQIAKPAVMSSSLYSAKQRCKKIQLAAVGKRGGSGAMALCETTSTLLFPSSKKAEQPPAPTHTLPFLVPGNQAARPQTMGGPSLSVCGGQPRARAPYSSAHLTHTAQTSPAFGTILRIRGRRESEREENTTEKKREDSFFLKVFRVVAVCPDERTSSRHRHFAAALPQSGSG